MSDDNIEAGKIGSDEEFDRWRAGLNKLVNAETGKPITMSDPLDTPINVLSAGEEFHAKSAPVTIEDALTNEKIELTPSEPVIIEDRLTGQTYEI